MRIRELLDRGSLALALSGRGEKRMERGFGGGDCTLAWLASLYPLPLFRPVLSFDAMWRLESAEEEDRMRRGAEE
jgi:hypothetical protein